MNATQFKISILLFVCFAAPLFSDNQSSSFQAPFATTTFAKRIEATGFLVDTIQTADKSYVSVSQIDSKIFFVRKIASSGRRVWERILTLQVERSASLAAITQTTDGGYILAGFSIACSDRYCDFFFKFLYAGILIKLRSDGSVEWKKEYSTNSNNARFTSLVSTADGGVIVTGITHHSLILARYASDGTILWSKSIPDLRVKEFPFPELVQTTNNSLILVANAPERAGALVIKVNDSGAIIWKKSLDNLFFDTIAATSHNGIVLAGNYNNKQLFVVRLKADGNVKSKLRYALQVGFVGVRDIIQTSDGGFTITGAVKDAGNRPSVFVAKIDSKGKASFQRTFRITGILNGRGLSVFALSHGYLLFGSLTTLPNTIILKLDSQGLLPGCDIVSSAAISPIPFGNLRISQRQINAAIDLTLGTNDLAGSSEAARRPVSDLCP